MTEIFSSVEVTSVTPTAAVLRAAKATQRGKARAPAGKDPSDGWWRRMCIAGHSPIRSRVFWIVLRDLWYWVSVHLVRHKIGVEHFITSQRTDRTGVNRNEARQDTPVDHAMQLNAEAVLTISKRRLCGAASVETRAAWRATVDQLKTEDPVLGNLCHPTCIWYGFCPEMQCCGFVRSPEATEARELLLSGLPAIRPAPTEGDTDATG